MMSGFSPSANSASASAPWAAQATRMPHASISAIHALRIWLSSSTTSTVPRSRSGLASCAWMLARMARTASTVSAGTGASANQNTEPLPGTERTP
ncbi:hypothetical protein D3C81_1575450 [compost metagenome]